MKSPDKVYSELMNLIIKFTEHGLVHGDFNEFNILISKHEKVTVIDFPQMISVNHPEAKTYGLEKTCQYLLNRYSLIQS